MGSIVFRKRLGIVVALLFVVACGGGGGGDGGGGGGGGGDDPIDEPLEVSFKELSGLDGDLGGDEVIGLGAMVVFTTALAEAILPDGIAGFLDSDPGGPLKPGAPAGPSKPGLPDCPTVTTPQIRVRNVDFTSCGTAFDGNVDVAWSLLNSNFALVFQPDFELAGFNVTGVATRNRVGSVGEGKGEWEVPAIAPIGLNFFPATNPIGIVTPPTAAPTMLLGPLTALRTDIRGSVGARLIVLWGAAGVIVDAVEIVVQLGGPDGPDADDDPDKPLQWSDNGCICPDSGLVQVDVSFAIDSVGWVYTVGGEDVTVQCDLDPAFALSGTLALEFDSSAGCGAYTVTYTPDQTTITIGKAEASACVDASGLTEEQKAALSAYLDKLPGTEVTVPLSAIQARIDEAVENLFATYLPGDLCQPELTE